MYGHVITKFSRMGKLLHFLTHGAPHESSAIKRVTMGGVDFTCQHEFNLATSMIMLICAAGLLTLMTCSSSMIIFVVNFPDCLHFTNCSEVVVSFGVSNIGIRHHSPV